MPKWAIWAAVASVIGYFAFKKTASAATPVPASAATLSPKQHFEQGKKEGYAAGSADGKAKVAPRVTVTRVEINATLTDPDKWVSDTTKAHALGYNIGYLDGYDAGVLGAAAAAAAKAKVDAAAAAAKAKVDAAAAAAKAKADIEAADAMCRAEIDKLSDATSSFAGPSGPVTLPSLRTLAQVALDTNDADAMRNVADMLPVGSPAEICLRHYAARVKSRFGSGSGTGPSPADAVPESAPILTTYAPATPMFATDSSVSTTGVHDPRLSPEWQGRVPAWYTNPAFRRLLR